MKKQFTRYEINQKIKMALVSHNVDLTMFTFSFSGKAAWFTGRLNKTSGVPLEHEEIETLCRALKALPDIRHLNFELEDWNISASPGSFFITRKTIAASAPARDQKPLIINTSETVEDILEDQKVNPSKTGL